MWHIPSRTSARRWVTSLAHPSSLMIHSFMNRRPLPGPTRHPHSHRGRGPRLTTQPGDGRGRRQVGPDHRPTVRSVHARRRGRRQGRRARSRAGERPSRSRLEGTLANHVTVHVTPTYKVERATTQPDPSSPRIGVSFPPLFSPSPRPPLPGLASTRRDPDRILLRPTAASAAVGARCPHPATPRRRLGSR